MKEEIVRCFPFFISFHIRTIQLQVVAFMYILKFLESVRRGEAKLCVLCMNITKHEGNGIHNHMYQNKAIQKIKTTNKQTKYRSTSIEFIDGYFLFLTDSSCFFIAK